MDRSILFLVIFLVTVIGKRAPLPKDPLEPNFIPSSHERILSHRPKHDDVSVEDGSKLAHYGLSGRRRLIPTSIKYNGSADYARVHDPKTDTRYHPKIWMPPNSTEMEGNETDISGMAEEGASASFVPPISSPRLPNPAFPSAPGGIPLLSPVPLPHGQLPPQPRPVWGQNVAPLPLYRPQGGAPPSPQWQNGQNFARLPQNSPQNFAPRPQIPQGQFYPPQNAPAYRPQAPWPQQPQLAATARQPAPVWRPQQQATVPQQMQIVQYWPQQQPQQAAPQPNYQERPQYTWPNNGK